LKRAFAAFYIAAIPVIFSQPIFANDEHIPPKDPNCIITVVATRKSGEASHQKYESFEKTKKDCEKAAALHRQNFAPQTIVKKKVQLRWLGIK
jgi:hypothetical protein